MVKFEKVSDGKYRAVCSIDINKQADDILRNISLDNVDNYLDANNDSLKKSLLARIIASYFFKDPSINFNKVPSSLLKYSSKFPNIDFNL